MRKVSNYYGRLLIFVIPAIIVLGVGASTFGQTCDFDKSNPSIESARRSFKTLQYKCSELELLMLLKKESLTLESKCEAHILMAAVYFAMLDDESNKKTKVIEQFVSAFKAYQDWQGELDINSDDFRALMKEAKGMVSSGEAETVPVQVQKSDCPSSLLPLVGTGLTAGSAVLYLMYTGKANDKWDEYLAGNAQPALYDDYKSTNDTRKIFGIATMAAGAITVFLWVKYFMNKGDCGGESMAYDQNAGGLKIKTGLNTVMLTYSF